MLAARVARAAAPRIAASAGTAARSTAVVQHRAGVAAAVPVSRNQSRFYAAEAKSSADPKPPIELFGVDGTYASALYTAAAKSSTLDATASALSRLNTTFANDPKLKTILGAPTLTNEDTKLLVGELLKAAGFSESAKDGGAGTVKNFLETLAGNNRLGILEGVCAKFEELMSAARGEVELTVTSAEELDRKTLQRLETAVGKSRFVGQGRKLKLVTKVQPDIRGGLIVEVGDRTIDLSVSSKMTRMNQLLREQL